jgi:hypothetical protein
MSTSLRHAFAEIGARLAADTFGTRFEIDIVSRNGAESYQMQRPRFDALRFDVMDVNPHLRHLVLDVSGERLPISGRYLCGHDESHWFVAGLEFGRRTMTVRGAMESLKPELVCRAQRRMGVAHRRHRRRTAVYVRQGEWFFLPRPKMHVADVLIEQGGRLTREGGKPHRVDELYRAPGRDETFVRGRVQHADHETIVLDAWHRVVRNNEVAPAEVNPRQQGLQRIAWLD